ncbi:polynucleotide kinase 3 phosphatase-domain-containing protein [Infundibulicybe gibba]|nr:polynucleotide kinase 3 phosphatase-domain-containing protein [Infundibulicybe gibba]
METTLAVVAGPSRIKRPASPTPLSGGHRIQKIHPFFNKPADSTPALDSTFRWLESIGSTCLHAINHTPVASAKVAAFDLDGTLIKSSIFQGKSKSEPAKWEWWNECVPKVLKDLHDSGHSIIIISNQALKPAALKAWKLKIASIASALPNVPFHLFAATAKDSYRKPMPGMWYALEAILRGDDAEIDLASSFFVGDAAGRQYSTHKADFAGTDRKWADNIGICFHTPEEYFLKLPKHTAINLAGFNVSSLPITPTASLTISPILPNPLKQELVLFVGYPCLGKTTFFHKQFKSSGYVHINQDTLKTREKCVKSVREVLEAKLSCVVDNTNRDAKTRKFYISLAKERDIPVRCFLFTGSLELAWHNNLYRAYNLPASVVSREERRDIVPYAAFSGFRDNYEEPAMDEGILEIKRVNWAFDGTMEERKHWSMWLQIDGK